MAKYQYGCLKVEVGDFNPTTGAITNWKEVDVYQNTIIMDEPEAQKTDHLKQGDPNPKVTRYGAVSRTIAQSIMDTSAASKAEHLGGTVTTVDDVTTWNAPKKKVASKIRAWRYTLEDGSILTVPCGDTVSRLASSLNDTDIVTIPQIITIKSTGVENVSDIQWTDAEE